MRAHRQRPRPRLEVVRATPGEAAPSAPAAEPCYVLQTPGLSDVVRLVMLEGDPLAPFDARPGIATLDLWRGAWTPEERLEVIHFFTRLMETRWRRRQETDAFVHRSMLEVVRE